MKAKVTSWILMAVLVFCTAAALADETPAEGITMEDWSWNPENVNNFTGMIDLSEYSGKKLTIKASAVTDPTYEMTDKTVPLFTIVNGSRVRMFMQSDTFTFTPDAEHPQFQFSGSIRMPAEPRVQRMKITVTALDAEGKELRSVNASAGLFDGGGTRSTGAFFIPFNIRNITLIVAGFALLVWSAAIVRNRVLNRKENK